MNKEDIIKFIDGIPFYRYEYTYFLYQKLEEKDKEIERLIVREQECVDKYLNMSKYASEMEGKYILEKAKNEKAIELIKEAGCYDEETKTFCDDIWEELPELLNILNGGDDNE